MAETDAEIIARLQAENERLTAERDEADRYSGAARRELDSQQESNFRHEQWKNRKKEKHGFHRNISMDRVWDHVEAKAAQTDEAVSLLKLVRSLVTEAGVPRYTIQPGAALNTVVENIDQFLGK